MQLIRQRPPEPLSRYIRFFWWTRRDDPQEFCEHILPSGGVQMVFALHENPITCVPGPLRRIEWSKTIVHGPQWSHYVAGPKPAGMIAGVAFRPGGAGAVLGVSMTELADQHVTLSTLWGKRGHELHERLLAAEEPATIFRILEQQLSARLHRPLLIHPAVAHALSACSPGPPARVANVQRQTGYSPRHFIALFRAAVGMTPKHFYRIQRFNSVARRLASAHDCDLADIAASCGYSDQAHLTREFRELSGLVPTQYRPGGADRALHHRAADGAYRRRIR